MMNKSKSLLNTLNCGNVKKFDKNYLGLISISIIILSLIYINLVSTNQLEDCTCEFKLENHSNEYLLRLPVNPCNYNIPKTSRLRDGYIETDSDLFVYTCNSLTQIVEKPKVYNMCNHLDGRTCSIVSKYDKLIYHIVSYMVFYFLSEFIIHLWFASQVIMIKLLSCISIIKSFIKKCNYCGNNYVLSHNCLKKTRLNSKSLYLIIVVILHFLSFKVNSSSLHSVVRSTNGSLLTVQDLPGLIQSFKIGNKQLSIVIKSTTVEYKISKLHQVVDIENHFFQEIQTVCEPTISDCVKKLSGHPDVAYSKTRDNFKCVIYQLKVCFICSNEYKTIGSIIEISDPELSINADYLLDGLKTDLVKVDIRNKFPDMSGVYFLDNNNDLYSGNICPYPDRSCWGKNIIFENKLVLLKDPKYTDQLGSEVILERCGLKDPNYKTSLKKIDSLVFNKSAYINVKLNYINMNVDLNAFPSIDECDGKAKFVYKISGCYNCLQGFNLIVESNCKTCCLVSCNYDKLEFILYLSKSSRSVKNLYSTKESVELECNHEIIVSKLNKISIEPQISESVSYVVNPESMIGNFRLSSILSLDGLNIVFINLIGLLLVFIFLKTLIIIGYFRRKLNQDEIYHIAQHKFD